MYIFIFANIFFYSFYRDEERDEDKDEGEKEGEELVVTTIVISMYLFNITLSIKRKSAVIYCIDE